jgi:hypothetical protein
VHPRFRTLTTGFLSKDLVLGPQRRVFFLGTSFQVRLKSGPGTENLDSGPLSRILATSVQVLEAVSWVITVTEIKIPKSRNSSTYPGPPFLQSTPQERVVTRKNFQALPGQTDTTVALICKIDVTEDYSVTLASLEHRISDPQESN